MSVYDERSMTGVHIAVQEWTVAGEEWASHRLEGSQWHHSTN